jgi:5'-3' exonuclease
MASTLRVDRREILLAVDLSYQTYRAAAAHPMLTCRDVFTGGLYGFLATLAKTVRETRATHIAFCQDRKPYLRSLEYPEYKQLRKKAADEEMLKRYTQSMALVLEFLGTMGFKVWGLDGFESDDLIGHCVMKYRHRFRRIYAASNDSDLFQLFWSPNFYVYTKDIASVINGESLMTTTGLLPSEFMLATALMGTHNDIAGIDGVGKVTSQKAAKDPALLRKYREHHAALIDRNLALIKLPHPKFPGISSLPQHDYVFDQRKLYRACGRYDIDVTLSMVNAFEQLELRNLE